MISSRLSSELAHEQAGRVARASMGSGVRLFTTTLIGATSLTSFPASAQDKQERKPTELRVDENALRQADDAFGVSIGYETVGIYSTADVRGFSPASANNIRINEMYFDLVSVLNPRIRKLSTVRVGITTLDFAFPAPTGVIDYTLRKPGTSASTSAALSFDSYGAATLEVDGIIPIVKDRLSAAAGLSLALNKFNSGTSNIQDMGALTLRWTPSPRLEIQPFFSRTDVYDYGLSRTYIPAGTFLPPPVQLGRRFRPDWANYAGVFSNYGVIARADIGAGWQFRAGVFRSEAMKSRDHFILLTGETREGAGTLVVIAEPRSKVGSTSGELRVSRALTDGPRLHTLILSARLRSSRNLYDGGRSNDLGPATINVASNVVEPPRIFGQRNLDRLSQQTYGIAYQMRWRDVGALNAGLQRTFYRKISQIAGQPPATTREQPWLFNFEGALAVSRGLSAYGGYTRGLEESGIAPANAVNRNEVLPPIVTSQRDIGLRWTVNPRLHLIAGAFDLRKPYFGFDGNSRYAQLGDVHNQGIEISFSGALSRSLDILAGAVISRPRVTGAGVAVGRLGSRPVNIAPRRASIGFDWRPPISKGLSFDATITNIGPVPATKDNLVSLPAKTLVDIGARYKRSLGGRPVSLRLTATNVFNTFSWTLRGAGSYVPSDGRRVTLRLIGDF